MRGRCIFQGEFYVEFRQQELLLVILLLGYYWVMLLLAGLCYFPGLNFSRVMLLLAGLEQFLFFHSKYGIILPIDELIFFKMVKTC